MIELCIDGQQMGNAFLSFISGDISLFGLL